MFVMKREKCEKVEPTPTIKKVIRKAVEEEAVRFRAVQPEIRYWKLQPVYIKHRWYLGEPDNPDRKIPELRIRGVWLERAGFIPGKHVSITVMDGLLVIRPAQEADKGE
jgi:hypothetical protein